MLSPRLKKRITDNLYLLAFFTSIHYAFVAYINSSFLARFIAEENIGLAYILAAIASILVIAKLPSALKKFGQLKTAISILAIDLVAIITLAITSLPYFSPTKLFQISDGSVVVANQNNFALWIPPIVIFSFLIFQISIVLNRIILDIYLEEFSKNSESGKNRGIALTTMNLAFVISPLIVGYIITNSNDSFWQIYLISAIFVIASLLLIYKKLSHIRDVTYHNPPFFKTLKKIFRDKNILHIYISSFLLEFFYSWMVIYTPIYLNENIGFGWSQIGIIFSIMLTPFVILEIPLGKIADKYLGEKEILITGFLIIALATGSLTFITGANLIVWSLALFLTRVGASAIEVMNDTYFFKKVKATDSDLIAYFRNVSPLAYVIGPIIASIVLYFFDYKYLFLILAAIMLSGVNFALSIEDTL